MTGKKSITPQKVFVGFFLAFVIVFAATIAQFFTSEKKHKDAQEKAVQKADVTPEKLQETVSKLPLISVSNAMKQPATIFVDIRTQQEFDADHIKDSIHIENFNPTDYTFIENIVLIHTQGNTPQSDEKLLKLIASMPDQYVTTVLDGGLLAWKAAGIATIAAPDPDNPLDTLKMRATEPRDLSAIMQGEKENQKISYAILDIRTRLNFEKEHIPEAIHIPLVELESRRKELPADKTIYLYGSNNLQGFNASVLLYQLGRIDTYTINGGFPAWKEFGYPTATNQ